MIEQIKSKLTEYTETMASELSERDLAGIGQIQMELDLLAQGHPSKSDKKSGKTKAVSR